MKIKKVVTTLGEFIFEVNLRFKKKEANKLIREAFRIGFAKPA